MCHKWWTTISKAAEPNQRFVLAIRAESRKNTGAWNRFGASNALTRCRHERSELRLLVQKINGSLRMRMGIHSGPVSGLVDVNDRTNIAGAGINVAQRGMDCGDAGHILLART